MIFLLFFCYLPWSFLLGVFQTPIDMEAIHLAINALAQVLIPLNFTPCSFWWSYEDSWQSLITILNTQFVIFALGQMKLYLQTIWAKFISSQKRRGPYTNFWILYMQYQIIEWKIKSSICSVPKNISIYGVK